MNTERSILKYMEFFASEAIAGKGIKDITTNEIISDKEKFNKNYTFYNAMMAGYFMKSKEYHNNILYVKYLNDIVNTENTPADFVGLINSVRLEDVILCVEKKAKNPVSVSDWYKKLYIAMEMGFISRSMIDNLEPSKKEVYENVIYEMAYRFDEVLNERKSTPEITSKLDQVSKVLKKEKKVALA